MVSRLLKGFVLSLTLAGCATVSTQTRTDNADGIAYHLPTGKLRLTVTDNAGVIAVVLGGPVMGPDPAFPMMARIPRGNLSDNNVTVSVDDKTTLLESVDVTSVGRVTDIATNLAKSFALQGSDATDAVVIYDNNRIVPTDIAQAAQNANAALQDYYTNNCRYRKSDALPFSRELKNAGQSDDDAAKAFTDKMLYCRDLALAGAADARSTNLIQASTSMGAVATQEARSLSTETRANCARGVCYRPLTPLDVTLSVRGVYSRSDTFLVPDPNTVLFVDLVGGAFATQKYTLGFTDGVLTSYKQDGQSEVVGLVSLPLAIAKAVLSVPAEALGLKQKNEEAKTSYLTAVAAAEAKQGELAQLCKASANRCPATAYKIIGGPITSDIPATSSSDDQGGGSDNDDNVPAGT